MKVGVGVDVGGTKISIGLVDQSGKVRKKILFRTANKKSKILKQIEEGISLVLEGVNKKEVFGIGVGLPGILDKKKGSILKLPNIKGFENFLIDDFLKKRFKLKIKIENDSVCAALAEYMFGNRAENMVLLTLGTGIGGGILLKGKIYDGKGRAPEPGHITIEKNGLKCKCGSLGCLEEYFSTRGILREARKKGFKESIFELQELAEKGNKKAKRIYEEAGKNFGIALSTIIKILDPDLIVLSGGLSKAYKLFLPSALKEMKKRTFFKLIPLYFIIPFICSLIVSLALVSSQLIQFIK